MTNSKITIDDLKAFLFAIVGLRKQYPSSQGKVYISLKSVYFYSENNKELLSKVFGKIPSYTREDILNIVNKLDSMGLVNLVSGDRGAKYLYLNNDNYLKFFETMNDKCSISTLHNIVFNKDEKICPKYIKDYYEEILKRRK